MERGVEQPRTGPFTMEEWFGLPEDVPGELVDGLLS
jgi:hypothetical protein